DRGGLQGACAPLRSVAQGASRARRSLAAAHRPLEVAQGRLRGPLGRRDSRRLRQEDQRDDPRRLRAVGRGASPARTFRLSCRMSRGEGGRTMRRRDFLVGTAALAAAWTASGRALGDPKTEASSGGAGPLTPPARGRIPVAVALTDGATVIDFAGPWEVFQD